MTEFCLAKQIGKIAKISKIRLIPFVSCRDRKLTTASLVFISPLMFPRKKEKSFMNALICILLLTLGNTWGFPLKMPGLTNQEFDFVLEKVQGRLAGWNAHLLSFARRVVLT